MRALGLRDKDPESMLSISMLKVCITPKAVIDPAWILISTVDVAARCI